MKKLLRKLMCWVLDHEWADLGPYLQYRHVVCSRCGKRTIF